MRLVCGVGINDINSTVQKWEKGANGKQKLVWICSYYKKWKYMIERCYSSSMKIKAPTYEGTYVTPEWLYFSNFKAWCKSYEKLIEGSIDDYQLDKDIIVAGNKMYSPSTCCFVTSMLNKFLTDSAASRGKYLLGVSASRGKYLAVCSDPFQPHRYQRNSKKIFLGRFTTEERAHWEYCKCKLELTKKIIKDGKVSYDKRIEDGLLDRFSALEYNAKRLYKERSSQ